MTSQKKADEDTKAPQTQSERETLVILVFQMPQSLSQTIHGPGDTSEATDKEGAKGVEEKRKKAAVNLNDEQDQVVNWLKEQAHDLLYIKSTAKRNRACVGK